MAAITHNNSTPTLEARIAVALSDNTPQARTLANLIAETETAIVEAEAQSATQQQRALDPILSPDPIKARELLEFAAFAAKRLRTVLPRLVGLHATIIAKERAQRWTAAADAIQTRRDALVQDFAETYPALVSQLVDLFERTRAMDAEVERINGSAPNSSPVASPASPQPTSSPTPSCSTSPTNNSGHRQHRPSCPTRSCPSRRTPGPIGGELIKSAMPSVTAQASALLTSTPTRHASARNAKPLRPKPHAYVGVRRDSPKYPPQRPSGSPGSAARCSAPSPAAQRISAPDSGSPKRQPDQRRRRGRGQRCARPDTRIHQQQHP